MNQFTRNVHSKTSFTENGAVSNSSTGSEMADQFGKAGAFRGRSYAEVQVDQSKLWYEDNKSSLQFAYYLRAITRKLQGSFTSEKVLVGQGARDESFKRLLWILENHPKTFYKNLWLLPIVGSWKDMWTIIMMARENAVVIDQAKVFDLITSAIKSDSERPLILKFLPAIKSTTKCTTPRAKALNRLAKNFCLHYNISPVEYRKLKSTGEAHVFQRIICSGVYDQLNFNMIPGRALAKLVSGKFLENHGLADKYETWIDSKPVAKFTGYVYELGEAARTSKKLIERKTIDKQFKTLLQKTNPLVENGRKVICAIDRSGSMETKVADGATSAMNVAESLGIYFSSVLEGEFKNWVIKFSERSAWVKLSGGFCDMQKQMAWGDCPSNTDFQSVIDSFVTMRGAHPNIPESDFPDTLLVVSDMQFDRSGTGSNYQVAINKLRRVFSQEYCDRFMFIWWDCTGRVKSDFAQTIDEPGGYSVSGFDGALVSMLVGGEKKIDEVTGKTREKTLLEKIDEALNQDAFAQLVV